MSASSQPQVPTTKLQDTEKDKQGGGTGKKEPEKTPATLEEDDEFEDFPVEGKKNPDKSIYKCHYSLVSRLSFVTLIRLELGLT